MIDWDDIRYFLNAVRAGSYTAAADRLSVNRTTIGRRLSHLEDMLGLSLYEQTDEGYRPTTAGSLVLDSGHEMERIVNDLEARLAHIRQGHVGTIRIAASAGIGSEFMRQVQAFRALFPDIKVEMLSSLDAIRSVTQRKADLAICLTATRPGHLLGPCICSLDQAPYASKACLDRQEADAGYGWIGWGHEMAALPDRWIQANVRPDGDAVLEVNSWTSLKEAVATGIGAAYLWCFAADRMPELVRLAPPDEARRSALWLLRRADVPPDRATSDLVDFLSHAIAEHCAA